MTILDAKGLPAHPSAAATAQQAQDDATKGDLTIRVSSVYNPMARTGAIRLTVGATVTTLQPRQAQSVGLLLLMASEDAQARATMLEILTKIGGMDLPEASRVIQTLIPEMRARHDLLRHVAPDRSVVPSPPDADSRPS
jgi:hypothetical protein